MKIPIRIFLASTCAAAVSLVAVLPRAGADDAAKPERAELPGIENAFRVTERILASSQPGNNLSFAALAKMGVKTIISVDGEKPAAEEAKKSRFPR